MGDLSIYNNIRSSKVTTGNAWQYAGMRSFDSDALVCPTRANVSDSGVVSVARDSINTYTVGCFSPLDRMVVENVQRPRYSTYLNASAISVPGVGDSDLPYSDPEYQSKRYYDTNLGKTWTGQQLDRSEMHPTYPLSKFQARDPGFNNAQIKEANKVQCFMDRTFEQRDCSASD